MQSLPAIRAERISKDLIVCCQLPEQCPAHLATVKAQLIRAGTVCDTFIASLHITLIMEEKKNCVHNTMEDFKNNLYWLYDSSYCIFTFSRKITVYEVKHKSTIICGAYNRNKVDVYLPL